MLRLCFSLLLVIHGLIHIVGFTHEVSKPFGHLWLSVGLLLVVSGLLMYIKKETWWIAACLAIVASQLLIIDMWQEAEWGTAVNIILLLAIVAGWGSWQFQRTFLADTQTAMQRRHAHTPNVISEANLAHLPAPVQRYLRYVGVLNKPRVLSMRLTFEGKMREKGKKWFPLTSVQYNFFDSPERLFFMKGHMYGMDVPGYHRYAGGIARMDIKLFGLFPLVASRGNTMNQAETVTFFNDMCCLAPATLIDRRIQWIPIDEHNTKAVFTYAGNSISATLQFNEQDQLVNFFSNDRYDVADGQQHRFSTPLSDYRSIDGYRMATFAEATWHYPDGPFVYGEFNVKEVTYNVQ